MYLHIIYACLLHYYIHIYFIGFLSYSPIITICSCLISTELLLPLISLENGYLLFFCACVIHWLSCYSCAECGSRHKNDILHIPETYTQLFTPPTHHTKTDPIVVYYKQYTGRYLGVIILSMIICRTILFTSVHYYALAGILICCPCMICMTAIVYFGTLGDNGCTFSWIHNVFFYRYIVALAAGSLILYGVSFIQSMVHVEYCMLYSGAICFWLTIVYVHSLCISLYTQSIVYTSEKDV